VIQLSKLMSDLDDPIAENVIADIKKDIEKFREKLWVIDLLTTEALIKKPIYWKDVAKECEIEKLEHGDELTLQLLVDSGIMDHREGIEDISRKAEKQYGLEKKLNEMVDKLKDLRVELMKYKGTGTYVLKGFDDSQQLLDDQLNLLLMMKSSPYIKPVLARANGIEAKIILIVDTLEGWLRTQRGWMYLEPIFASEDIKQKMPDEKKKFDAVDKIWRTTMDQFLKESNLWETIETDKVKSEFDHCNKLLDEIQKSLSEYLEMKRRYCPRFYFLSDEDLL
jgi:dynein heavy chain